ncbi:hypothetical protein ACLOJK_040202, partial [Asimina triloba]
KRKLFVVIKEGRTLALAVSPRKKILNRRILRNSGYKKNRLEALTQPIWGFFEGWGDRVCDMGSSNYGSSSDDYDLSAVDHDGTRARRSQQLRALQSLIPNIRQTDDELAILEETRDYLQRIHHDADEIQRELAQRSGNSSSSAASHENQH